MRAFVLVLALACGLLGPSLSAAPASPPTLHLGPAASEPTRVLLLGDSIALTLGVGLARNSEKYGVAVTNKSTLGCDLDPKLEIFTSGKPGPATPGCDNWQTLWPFLTASVRPQVVVLGLGRWEVTNHLYQGHWVHIGQPAWNAHLTADFNQAIAIFARFGAKVVLLTMPYIDPSDRQPDGKPWVENTPERADLYNALVRRVADADPAEVSVLDLNKMLDPSGVYTSTVDGVTTRWSDGIHVSAQGGEFLRHEMLPPMRSLGHQLELDAAEAGLHAREEARGSRGSAVSRVSTEEVGDPHTGPPTAEVVVESVPVAMSLAPQAGGAAFGAEIIVDEEAGSAVESMRSGLMQAGPLAAAGVVANGANVVVTVLLARLISTHSYGVLNQLTGLFLILSMPGSAVVVAVVRRVTLWHEDGSGHLVRRWAGRIHRQGSIVVVIWGVIIFVSRHSIAVLLGQRSGIGIAAVLTAAAFFVLLSLDRGLLQARRAYRPLAANLLVEGGVRTAAILVLVGAGTGPSGAAIGILVAEVITAAHARWAAVRVWSEPHGMERRSWAGGWLAAVRADVALGGADSERRRVVTDLVIASVSLSVVALLQNVDVLVVGRQNPSHSGAYAAVSVTSKAIVFGAIVLGGYLLPEAAIRWRQGGHALRQLAVVLVLLAGPAAVLLLVALTAPHVLLQVVFHHAYTTTAAALAPLVGAMIFLSISVVLTMYLLAVGRRWVTGVLVAGGAVLTLVLVQLHGAPRATALADLAVQGGVALVIVAGFTIVHRVHLRRP